MSLPADSPISEIEKPTLRLEGQSVLDPFGKEVLVMNAIMGEDGEMVATEELAAAVKIETFRNVAERGGTVDIKFNVTAPPELLDSDFQLQFTPELLIGTDTMCLDRVFVTGKRFREAQNRGYDRYEKYLSTLKTDPDAFLDEREMNIFLERRGPLSDRMHSIVREHYTDKLGREINGRRIARKDEVLGRCVRRPFEAERLRLDTVIVSAGGAVCYEYLQTLKLDYSVRKFDLLLEGRMLDTGSSELDLPLCGPLTYYVSSMSALAEDPPERAEDKKYCAALEALKRREYRAAVPVLAAYADYNAALCYAALNYNGKALEILESLEKVPKVEYLKALLYSRTGRDISALEAYDNACRQDVSFVHRGNLDPEIRELKNKYKLKF